MRPCRTPRRCPGRFAGSVAESRVHFDTHRSIRSRRSDCATGATSPSRARPASAEAARPAVTAPRRRHDRHRTAAGIAQSLRRPLRRCRHGDARRNGRAAARPRGAGAPAPAISSPRRSPTSSGPRDGTGRGRPARRGDARRATAVHGDQGARRGQSEPTEVHRFLAAFPGLSAAARDAAPPPADHQRQL